MNSEYSPFCSARLFSFRDIDGECHQARAPQGVFAWWFRSPGSALDARHAPRCLRGLCVRLCWQNTSKQRCAWNSSMGKQVLSLA